MGLADWFTFKTPAQRIKEERAYERWAFPYGPEQKEKLQAIVKELIPEETPLTAMALFLMGREGYRGKDAEEYYELVEKGRERRLQAAYWKIHSQLPRKLKRLMSRYLVLIEADDQVGPDLNYPTVDQLREAADEIDKML